jgi:hypothetical protein
MNVAGGVDEIDSRLLSLSAASRWTYRAKSSMGVIPLFHQHSLGGSILRRDSGLAGRNIIPFVFQS